MQTLSENISFRRANPLDADLVAPLIYASGPDACDYIFKNSSEDDALKYIHYAFQKEGGELTYSKHICAEYQGKVVGVGAIWSGKSGFANLIADLKNILSFYGIFNGIAILIRGLKIEFLIQPPKKNEYALAHLGIAQNIRGKGIGTKLINHLLQSVELKRDEKVILDVSFINPKAQKLYEQLNFKVVKTNVSNLQRNKMNIKVPGHYRMELGTI